MRSVDEWSYAYMFTYVLRICICIEWSSYNQFLTSTRCTWRGRYSADGVHCTFHVCVVVRLKRSGHTPKKKRNKIWSLFFYLSSFRFLLVVRNRLSLALGVYWNCFFFLLHLIYFVDVVRAFLCCDCCCGDCIYILQQSLVHFFFSFLLLVVLTHICVYTIEWHTLAHHFSFLSWIKCITKKSFPY